jgi:hypothetical protein
MMRGLETECFSAFRAASPQSMERGQLTPGLGRSQARWVASPIGPELRIGSRILRVSLDSRGLVLLELIGYQGGWLHGTVVLAITCLASEAPQMAAWAGRLLANPSALPPCPVLWHPTRVWTCSAREMCMRLAEERPRAQPPGPL